MDAVRSDTPGCASRTHLNNAGASLMPTPVIACIKDYLDLEADIGGYEAQAQQSAVIDAAYQSVANLLACEPRNIAFTENATASYTQALSSIPFKHGDIILTTRNDYASNQIQFLSLQARLGIRIMHAPDLPQGGVDTGKMISLIDEHRPKLVCVTHVPTNSGLIQDVEAIGAACRNREAIYLVDACQSVGQMPINVNEIGCDFLSATARKFLRGPRGSGFLYVSDRILQQGLEPLFIDMHGANWTGESSYETSASAKRFENWEFAWALVLATAVAADYAAAIGLQNIRQRNAALLSHLRSGLSDIRGITVLGRGDETASIVTLTVQGHDPADLVTVLRGQKINVSSQGIESAVMDYASKNVSGALRVSPHYYNTDTEIEALLSELDSLVTAVKA